MLKISGCLLLVASFAATFPAWADEQQQPVADVRQPCITYEPLILNERKPKKGFTGLSKVFGVQGASRLVLMLNKHHRGELNPQGDPDYPETQSLKDLPYGKAVEIFGTAIGDINGVKSFQLMPSSSSLEYRGKHLYLLEAKFKHNKLVAYRLTGDLSQNPRWHKPRG